MVVEGKYFTLFIYFLQLGREVLDIAANVTEIGVTTEEIDRIVHEVWALAMHVLTACGG